MSFYAVRLPISSYTHALAGGEKITVCGRSPSDDAIREAYELHMQFARTRPLSMLCAECLKAIATRVGDLVEESRQRQAV
ncbi:MAG TPA: hypothetical protein VNC78_12060 [Actinomycetota bacterium]|nr:hypothetical protein [Actinomycetota bacterium]